MAWIEYETSTNNVSKIDLSSLAPAYRPGYSVASITGVTVWPTAPRYGAVLQYSAGSLVWSDGRTLTDLKDEAWGLIKGIREAIKVADLVTPYGVFDCALKDQTNITNAILLAQTLVGLGLPANTDFTLANNTTVTLTVSELITVGLLLGQRVQLAHSQGRDLRTRIYAASSAAELELIEWVY